MIEVLKERFRMLFGRKPIVRDPEVLRQVREARTETLPEYRQLYREIAAVQSQIQRKRGGRSWDSKSSSSS